MKKPVIDLGGRQYDSETGAFLGINQAMQAKSSPELQKTQPATTLNRQFVNKPQLKLPAKANDARAKSKPQIVQFKRKSMDIVRAAQAPSPKISKFNPGDFNPTNRPVVISEVRNPDVIVTPEQQAIFKQALDSARQAKMIDRYRAAQIARARRQKHRQIFGAKTPTQVAPTSSGLTPADGEKARQVAKNAAINQALAQATPQSNKKPKPNVSFWQLIKPSRWLVSVSLVVLILIGLLAYLNRANLYLAWVNYQTGFSATLPTYRPNDYQIQTVATQKPGQTLIKLADSNNKEISITQEKSSWDSEAVLENVVKPEVGEDYITYREQGLTIYAYAETKLAWINGGILYQISATADTPSEQLRRMATSL